MSKDYNERVIAKAKTRVASVLKALETSLGVKVEGIKIKRELMDQKALVDPAPEIEQPTESYKVFFVFLK
jgi:hypothetical protein